MIQLPESLRINRNEDGEKFLLDKSRAWVERQSGDRATDGKIHASDLLDPRYAYFSKKFPQPISDRLVPIFLIGRVLHAFIICAVEGTELDWAADSGSSTSKELGIVYSPDMNFNGKVREIKTSRAMYEPKTTKDLSMYCEQVLIYMAAENQTKADIWVLFLNAKDAGKTSPAYRVYEVTISKADLVKLQRSLRQISSDLKSALRRGRADSLPLCRKFKCGVKNCEYWNKCKPMGRYGVPERKWEV